MDEGLPIAYLTLDEGVTVYASDGAQLGTVDHVVAAPEKDIFHGIVMKDHRRQYFIAADDVASLHGGGLAGAAWGRPGVARSRTRSQADPLEAHPRPIHRRRSAQAELDQRGLGRGREFRARGDPEGAGLTAQSGLVGADHFEVLVDEDVVGPVDADAGDLVLVVAQPHYTIDDPESFMTHRRTQRRQARPTPCMGSSSAGTQDVDPPSSR